MDESGATVEPAVPHFLSQIKRDDRATRLDLASWLVSKDNPLVARVFVNRLWKMLFGRGLSVRLDDLGSQGETPVHPELPGIMMSGASWVQRVIAGDVNAQQAAKGLNEEIRRQVNRGGPEQ